MPGSRPSVAGRGSAGRSRRPLRHRLVQFDEEGLCLRGRPVAGSLGPAASAAAPALSFRRLTPNSVVAPSIWLAEDSQALSNSAMTPLMVLSAPTSQLGASPRAFPAISSLGLPPSDLRAEARHDELIQLVGLDTLYA